ncbi:MAG: GNAT family N-acetyltransferase [Aeromicrobium sp.]
MPDAAELTQRWIAAWVHVRSIEVSQLDGWPLVHTRSRTRETELICRDPGPEAFTALMRHIDGDPRAMLTVIAEDIEPYAALELPPGVRVDRHDETLMTVELKPGDPPLHDSDLMSRWDIHGNSVTLRLETDDSVAAEGTIGVLGDVAVFDAIETSPKFRRRGLGRCVVSMLNSYALDRGASTGILAATSQGRMLYESLGWDVALNMRSLMGAR